jgi:carnitine O-acetyltransferase
MQLASYRLLGKQIATYESSQTRAFLHGRTETTRSVSTASEKFVKRMGIRPDGDQIDSTRRTEKIELLHKACYSHAKYLRDAANGLGCDRHMFGLSMLIEDGEPVPALFKNELFIRSKTWRLSTSTLPTCPGFGPVVEDGIGIGYHIFSDRCYFTITARKKNDFTVEAMSHLLEEALLEMQMLVDLDQKARSKL